MLIFAPCEVAGGIVNAALEDMRINNFLFPGFPQIHISEFTNNGCVVTISFFSQGESFNLTYAEAEKTVKKFRGRGKIKYDPVILRYVQTAMGKLEHKCIIEDQERKQLHENR